MVEACVRAAKEGRKFRIIIVIPAIPGFAGDLRDDAAIGTRAIMDYQYKSINRGERLHHGPDQERLAWIPHSTCFRLQPPSVRSDCQDTLVSSSKKRNLASHIKSSNALRPKRS